VQDGVEVQRADRAWVDDLKADTGAFELLGRILGQRDHPPDGHDGDVVTLSHDVGLTEGIV